MLFASLPMLANNEWKSQLGFFFLLFVRKYRTRKLLHENQDSMAEREGERSGRRAH